MIKFNMMSKAALATAAHALGGANAGDPPADPAPAPEEPETTEEQADPPAPPAPAAEPDAPAPAPEPTDADEGPAAEVVLATDAAAVANERFSEGRKAERDRTAAVLGSDAGRANTAQAAWMLANAPDATADSIIKSLGSFPAGGNAGQPIPDTNLNVGPGKAVDAQDANEQDVDKIWASSNERVGHVAGSTNARSDSGGFIHSSVPAGGATLVPGAAIPPTGN